MSSIMGRFVDTEFKHAQSQGVFVQWRENTKTSCRWENASVKWPHWFKKKEEERRREILRGEVQRWLEGEKRKVPFCLLGAVIIKGTVIEKPLVVRHLHSILTTSLMAACPLDLIPLFSLSHLSLSRSLYSEKLSLLCNSFIMILFSSF